MPNRNIEGYYSYKYQGQEKDSETGMEAFELRLWDGRIGRWLTTDPYNEFASPYLGMGNNPITLTDPDGGHTEDDYKLVNGKLEFWRKNNVDRIFNDDGTKQLGGDFDLGTFSVGMDFGNNDYLFSFTELNTAKNFENLLSDISFQKNNLKEVAAIWGDSKIVTFAFNESTSKSADHASRMIEYNFNKKSKVYSFYTQQIKVHTFFHTHPTGSAEPSPEWVGGDLSISGSTGLRGLIRSGNGGRIEFYGKPGQPNFLIQGKRSISGFPYRRDNTGEYYKGKKYGN